MKKDDIFLAMIEEEINQYSHFFFYHDKKWIENKEYEKVANASLKKTRYLGVSTILFIFTFSIFSVFHFVQFGTNGGWISLFLGLLSWVFIIYFTYFYTRDILQRRKTMERVLKLLIAREEYYQKTNEKIP